jgi:hypothetical protein
MAVLGKDRQGGHIARKIAGESFQETGTTRQVNVEPVPIDVAE